MDMDIFFPLTSVCIKTHMSCPVFQAGFPLLLFLIKHMFPIKVSKKYIKRCFNIFICSSAQSNLMINPSILLIILVIIGSFISCHSW